MANWLLLPFYATPHLSCEALISILLITKPAVKFFDEVWMLRFVVPLSSFMEKSVAQICWRHDLYDCALIFIHRKYPVQARFKC